MWLHLLPSSTLHTLDVTSGACCLVRMAQHATARFARMATSASCSVSCHRRLLFVVKRGSAGTAAKWAVHYSQRMQYGA